MSEDIQVPETGPSIQSSLPDYPVNLHIEYAPKLSRLKTLFRFILIIPIVLLFLAIAGGIAIGPQHVVVGAGGLLILGPTLMILFRKRYPRWWFDWNLNFLRFAKHITAYLLCLIDKYPSADQFDQVHIEVKYPESRDLMRGLPLVKWFLAIPHYVVLIVIGIIGLVIAIIGWFAVLVTGRYPKPLFNYLEGYLRYAVRVTAYAFLMMTDQYPPFRLRK